MASRSAAVSHVGKIRSNNQDSGYSGHNLFVVADGMGGHAGGDVASAIAIKRIAEIDQPYATTGEAEFALHSALVAANGLLTDTVFEHPELTGMGTTVSGLVLVDDHVVIAHIGDSRVYLFRDGELSLVTADHTFVQRLVDSGRITPEEAAVHPRRSVLMRVLGDVDASPEIDTLMLDTRPGDRWLLCTDGLSSYVQGDKIQAVLESNPLAGHAADRLLKESLDAGAPDNVTIVLLDIDGESSGSAADGPRFVGSAAAPLTFEPESTKRPLRLPSLLLHPLKSAPEDSHFEPESDEYLQELIAEDRRRARRRRITWLTLILLAIAAAVIACVLAYQWTQTKYYVGVDGDTVAIFQGVQQSVGPLPLSSVFESTDLHVDELTTFSRERVLSTISAESLEDARAIVDRLEANANG